MINIELCVFLTLVCGLFKLKYNNNDYFHKYRIVGGERDFLTPP